MGNKMKSNILVDTSYWVDHLRGSVNGRPLRKKLFAGERITCTEPIQMEILAGATNAQDYLQFHSMLSSLVWAPIDPVADFEAAARIYLQSRAIGITPGQLMDCLIVAVALRTKSTLMTRDRNQTSVAKALGVKVLTR